MEINSMYIVKRCGVIYRMPINAIVLSDLVLCTNNIFVLACDVRFPRKSDIYTQRIPNSRYEDKSGWIVLVVAAIALLAWGESENDLSARWRRRVKRNDVPLTNRQRARVRERDEEYCSYCGCYAPKGHVDHRRSRANGGSNHLNNLSWSCPPCNLKKGSLNANQFTRKSGI